MTSSCANPACKAPFRYFRTGTIYLLDKRDGGASNAASHMRDGIEYFWLCGECARTLRMGLDPHGVAIVERRDGLLVQRKCA